MDKDQAAYTFLCAAHRDADADSGKYGARSAIACAVLALYGEQAALDLPFETSVQKWESVAEILDEARSQHMDKTQDGEAAMMFLADLLP